MQFKFLIQQCLMAIAVTTAIDGGEHHERGLFDLEFGRATYHQHYIADSEVRFRELLEEDLLFLSMSMSLSMSLDYNPAVSAPTPSPTKQNTQSPTSLETSPSSEPPQASFFIDDSNVEAIQCEGDAQILSIGLEVETAIGKDGFEGDLENALRVAFANIYSFCGTRRLSGRILMDESFVGSVSIEEQSDESCSAQSNLASSCHVAVSNFEVYGDGIDTQGIRESMAMVFADSDFDNGLLLNGIVDVRLREDPSTEAPTAAASDTDVAQTNKEAAVSAPLAAGDNAASGRAEGPKVLSAILAATAGTILLAVIVRKFYQKPTPDGKYDTDSDSQEELHTMPNTSV
mmetsp:Transcript_14016/g.22070  ORF Transcript_14016/g.22070 Transcript_14016/m.22070 type:complete len:345 (-) Transcript_14016:180-1214(-)